MGKAEEIRGALDELDSQVAKDVISLLLISQGSVYSRVQSNNSSSQNVRSIDSVDFANFAQAITYLKSKYKFKELSRFSTEADLVYVDTGDRKVLLTDRNDPARFSAPQPQRRAVEDTYSNEDEYFENAFEPSYHRSAKKNSNSSENASKNNDSSAPAVQNLESAGNNSDNQNVNSNSDDSTFDNKKGGNSRFSSLEL